MSEAPIDNAQILLLDEQLDINEYRSSKQKFEVAIKELEAETKPQISNSKDIKQYSTLVLTCSGT